jgi:hypothetical protein
VFVLIHKCQQSLDELRTNAETASDIILAFEEMHVNTGRQMVKVMSQSFSGMSS